VTRLRDGRSHDAAQITFKFDWALKELPEEAGFISIRGPRQYGKSTWLHENIIHSLEAYGPGCIAYLNGDLIPDQISLREQIRSCLNSFRKSASIKRIFIDEISAIDNWPNGVKPLLDSGELSDVLIVSTGSRASDIRRGIERLPGRKGRLDRTSYIFPPLSFSSFCEQAARFQQHKEEDWVELYLLSGGSPIAASELLATGSIPEYVFEISRDRIFGEFARTGRSRAYLLAVMQTILERGGHPVGFTKLARESGLANNTAASDYINLLSDIFVIGPSYAWDISKKHANFKRPCKFHFINLLAAISFMPNAPRSLVQLRLIDSNLRGSLFVWLAAQELFSRTTFVNTEFPEHSNYWMNDSHEIDFILDPTNFLEIKAGQAHSWEFSWFANSFAKSKLYVVSESSFEETSHTVGYSWREWLSRG
jgi:predicted AAA+ superfamily ATPase